MEGIIIISDDKDLKQKYAEELNQLKASNFCSGLHYATSAELLNKKCSIHNKGVILDLDCLSISIQALQIQSSYVGQVCCIIGFTVNIHTAYQAFKAGFHDVFVKPFNFIDLIKSIYNTLNSITPCAGLIPIHSKKDFYYLKTEDILFLKADNNTTDIHLNNNDVIPAFKTLKTFEHCLPSNFVRIQKSFIVNTRHVYRINYGKKYCKLRGVSQQIPFTINFDKNIKALQALLNSQCL